MEEQEQLQRQIDDLKRRLDNVPLYFCKRLSNALASPNYVKNLRGWRFKENGDIEIFGIEIGANGALSPGLIELFGNTGDSALLYVDSNAYLHFEGGGFKSENDIVPADDDGGAKLGTTLLRWSDIKTVLINGATPLAGTKVYYVSDTSGGAVTRKLTFVGGVLT